ncbi:oligosaccharide flippase family protein [Vibrio fluvialis]|uniref:oligosaccharide flippase family protein n=1 Tax=Vibrio fluvialis TaxID=676 RepID=UPI001F434B40|nr:oligosaccharide flippase family protein [Vibrio fluvialis]MCE7602181.1 oligosaccharide flippase family protein [Vibrio fluvialis]
MQELLVKYQDEVLVIKNFFSLVLIKLANFAIPLVTLPYVIRVVGVDNVGAINLASSIMVYISVVAMFGFNYNGTKYIAKHSSELNKCSRYYSGAIGFQIVLLFVGLLILSLLVTFIPIINDIKLVCFLTFGVVIGQVFNSIWVFQGLQKMKYITGIDLMSKVLFTTLIFLFVKEKNDYWLVPLFTVCGSLVSGITCQFIIKNKFKFTISLKYIFNISVIKWYVNEGKNIFLQQVFVSIYGPLTILILGIYTSTQHVGYYTIAEKLINIPVVLVIVAVQAYYPYAVKLFDSDIIRYRKQLIYIVTAIVISMAIISTVLVAFHEVFYKFFTGNEDNLGSKVLSILGLGLAFSALGQFLTQVFITIDKQKTLTKISLFTMLITCVASPLVIKEYGVLGLSYYTIMRQLSVISVCLIVVFLFFKPNKGKLCLKRK